TNDNEPVANTAANATLMTRRQQVRTMFTSKGGEEKNPEWYTPPWLINHFYAANDNQPFDLDPCSPCVGDAAPVSALQHFTVADDGLAQDWRGRVWLNPPYHSLGRWLEKAADSVWCRHMPNAPTTASAEREKPLCEAVVGIIPVRTHTRYWRKFVADHARVFFVSGKIGFLKGVGGKGVEVTTRLPEGLAIVIWGNHKPFSDYLGRLPASVIDIYERSAPTIPDHPVRYWSAL
ncbi:site-specific DNA methylase, partial [Paramagnetospirillum caucaseum]